MTTNLKDENESLSRREREKLAHRQEIMDAATRIFAKKGFFHATLEEIAQEAEFSKGTLYLYFASKEDLLYSILNEKSMSILHVMKKTLSGEKSFKEELYRFFLGSAEVAFKEKDFFMFLMSQHASGFKACSQEKAAELHDMHKQFDEIFLNRIVKAVEKGELRNINPGAVNGMIHGAMENMMITHWDCKTLKELQNKVSLFIDILFNGIAEKREAGSDI